MGFLANVHQRGTWTGPWSSGDKQLAEIFGSGRRTIAGPIVTELTAMMVSAFWNGVDQISSDTAKLPLNLMKRLPQGGSDPYTDSKVYRLLKFRPNPETGSFMFRKTFAVHALVYGNGYAEIVRDVMGRPTALWLLHPNRVQPFYAEMKDGKRKPLRYRVDGEIELAPTDILHLAGLSDDAVVGFNLVSIAREALGLALASQQFASAFFGNGTRFGGVLSSDHDLDEDQKEEIRKSIEAIHAKADKAFRMLVLGAGFKFTQSGVNPSEAQMSEIRDQQVMEIARFLNMPLHKLKLAMPGAVSYASVEMADLDYYKGPILTWTKAIEEELDGKLISPLEWGRQFFRHNNNAFLRGDIKSRYDALGIARAHGVISANEWRDLEDMNPQPGDQGNLYLVQGANVPQDKISELTDANIKKASTPPAPPAAPAPSGGGDETKALRDAVERFDAAQALLAQAEADLAVKLRTSEETVAAKDGEIANLIAKVATFEQMVADRQRDVEQLQAAQADHLQRLDEAAAALAAAFTERDQAAAAARTAQADAEAAEARRAELAQQLVAVAAAVTSAETVAAEAREVAQVAEAQALAATTDRDALKVTSAALQQEAEEAKRLVEVARAEQQRLEAVVAEAEAAKDAILTAGKAKRIAEISKLARQITKHRKLIADVIGRLVEREVDRAKAKKTSDAMRAWIETFYGPFEDAFANAILPAVDVILEWKDSDENPRDVAIGMAQRYCEESKSQLRAFFGATSDEFTVAVDHLLKRWEQDRAASIADALLEEEIAHLRELERQP
jgi:HK97 family phage portal protein